MKCSQEVVHLRKAFAPFFSTCSMASRRNVASSTRAISTVSELRMAPTASPLNFALVVSSTWKIRPCTTATYCQVRQPLLVSRFSPRRTTRTTMTSLASAFSVSLSDLLSLPYSVLFTSFCSVLPLLSHHLFPLLLSLSFFLFRSLSSFQQTHAELLGKFVASSTN